MFQMERAAANVNAIDRQSDLLNNLIHLSSQHRSREVSEQQKHVSGQGAVKPIAATKEDEKNGQSGYERGLKFGILPAVSSGSPLSNLERFLQCTTPRVASQYLSKSYSRVACPSGWTASYDPKFFFSLSDLWDSLDEWSAYGAGVPIVLSGEETVVQYYVPYLSALQIYTSSSSGLFAKSRRLGDDSDVSDTDFRDSSSETSSDGETERHLNYNRTRNWRGFHGMGADSVSDRSLLWNSEVAWQESVMDDNNPWRGEKKPGYLQFEFFEKSAPCIRVPLFDKISELTGAFPALRSLRSIDLLPSSWMSVAWYPIYRIPTGPTLRDLAACFLTYHSLSTPLPGSIGLEQQISGSGGIHKLALQPFGFASYKFRGPVWNSAGALGCQFITSLQRSAELWLKQLHVQHPDYEYFLSHSRMSRH
eukprot:c28303_g1_i1 orf=177-1439(+)